MKSLFKCQFDISFKSKLSSGTAMYRPPIKRNIHVVTEGDAIKAADKAKEIALRQPGIESARLREVVFMLNVDE